ncbi:MAG: bifunctional oligoribonuclease/PAP phosphatase NrnA, partial [Candidatus Edwardsbacteria bacterium]|nr:bifunctional oligoribonuclease/PAP phosphatase NrnA [Candidatus Edwardsbacteria bacterium]
MSLADIAAAVARHRKILITSHTNPDGDNIASQLGMALILETLGKRVTILDQDPVPARYHYLPGWEKIESRIEHQAATLALVLDCAGIDRIGKTGDIITPATMEIANVDHHISNTGFGQYQYVDPSASSTCELVFRIAQKLGVKLTKEKATILLSGLMTDTGGFRYSGATPGTLRTAAQLAEAGADLTWVAEQLYMQQPANQLRLLGELLASLKVEAGGKLAWMAVTQEQLKRHNFNLAESEEFVTYAIAAKGTEVGILFKEQNDGVIRISFRSKGRIDVNRLAGMFGGGGHVSAAGARIKGALVFSAPSFPFEESLGGIDIPIMLMAGENDPAAVHPELP